MVFGRIYTSKAVKGLNTNSISLTFKMIYI